MKDVTRVLLVDDDRDDAFVFEGLLREIPNKKWRFEWASSYDAGRAAIQRGEHDACFLDYRLGAQTGLDFLKESIAEGCQIPIILLTGYGEHEVDQAAMRLGAADYLVKDQMNALILERCIRYSLHRAQTLEALRAREAQVLVQDRLASVGLLASSLAHEIGTPLGVIRGRAEYLALRLKQDEETKKNADIIIAQIDRVSGLIRSLLNLARGDEVKKAGAVSLAQAVNEVTDLLAHETRKNDIAIRNKVGPELTAVVSAEAASLHQVLLNLLINSIHAIVEAIQKGRRSGHFILIHVTDEDSQWALHVQDSGAGISAVNLRNLFRPFFTTKEIGVGTGLGLATSYRIVESCGGTIRVSSREGEGTTFSVFLPKGASSPSLTEKKGPAVHD